MKKTITITMIVIILLNLISMKSFAATDVTANPYAADGEAFDLTPQETGTHTVENDNGENLLTSITGTTYSGGTVFKPIVKALTLLPQASNQLLESFVEITTDSEMTKFTIYDTVMGHYDLFNIDYLDIPTTLDTDKSTEIIEAELIDQIKYNMLRYYGIIRNISIGISLFVLIYIGIRMAISTVASDQARYKKMFISWVESIIILFVMPYIITAIITVGEALTNVFYYLRGSIVGNGEVFETVVRNEAWPGLFEKSGFDLALWSLIYWCLLFLQIKSTLHRAIIFLKVIFR